MSSPARVLALTLATTALVILAACDSSEDPDGRYSSLLRIVADQPAFRDGVTIVDYEAIRALPGYEDSRPLGISDEEWAADPQALSNALGWHGVAIRLREILGAGWEYLPPHLDNWELGFGFGLADVDLALTAGIVPPRTLHAIGGDFDPEAIQGQLQACAECAEGEQRNHRGERYFTWGEGQTMAQRLTPPAVDDLGRGGNFVFDSNYIVRSNFIETLEASIDASQGRSSLLDDGDFALLADELDTVDALALFVSGRTLGPRYADELFEQVRDNEFLEPLVTAAWDVPAAELLGPYQAYAVGVGVSDDEPFTLVLLTHDTEEAAAANVGRMEQRIETGVTARDGRTWAESVSSYEITSEGRLLTAVLRGESYFANLTGTPALIVIEALLAHE